VIPVPFLPALALAALAAALDVPASREDAAPIPPSIPPELTFEDAVRIARARSPDAALADAGVASARAQVRAAGAIPNPAASFMAGWSSQCADPGCTSPAYVATLGDQGAVAALVTGQRGLAVDAAGQGLQGAEAARLDALRNLEFQVKSQFVATSVAWQGVAYGRQEEQRAQEVVAAARKRLSAGAMPAADVARLEVMRLQIRQAVDRMQLGQEQARVALGRLLGVRDGAPTFTVAIGPTRTATPPPQLAGATLPALTAEALRRRPDLAAARAQLEAARAQAELARRQVIPAFQLQAQYAQQGATGRWFTPPTASVGLSLPLPVLYQQQGQIGAADAAVSAAEATVAKVEAQAVADVASAFAAFESTRGAAKRARDELLVLSRDVLDAVSLDFGRGTASLLDYLDAQRSRIVNEVEYLSILQGFWTSVFALEQAVGTSFTP
jgi:cobalt-zinc-cadmium efflux system outer membrane protein